jgi:predicted dehydrogenase
VSPAPLRVALLGCGGIGGRHAAAVAELPDLVRLVACCGRDAERTAAFAARFGARPFVDFHGMLESASPDILVVALPPFAHAGEVEAAARAGVALLVEKPIALDMARAEAMVEAVEASGVAAACGFMYRFGAAVSEWHEAAASGLTGQAGHFSGQFHCNAVHAPWWRDAARSGGQMVEQLIHLVDLARVTLGMPSLVYARAANLFHRGVEGYSAEDVSAIVLGYDDGRIGVLHASNAAVPGRWAKQWQIVAERMTGIFAGWNEATFYRTVEPVAERRIAAEHDVFVAQIADLAAAVREGRPPTVPLADGAASLRIALAARRSAREMREVAP